MYAQADSEVNQRTNFFLTQIQPTDNRSLLERVVSRSEERIFRNENETSVLFHCLESREEFIRNCLRVPLRVKPCESHSYKKPSNRYCFNNMQTLGSHSKSAFLEPSSWPKHSYFFHRKICFARWLANRAVPPYSTSLSGKRALGGAEHKRKL